MTTFSGRDFEGGTFADASLRGATFRGVDLSGVTLRSVYFDRLDLDSHDLAMSSLLVNGVDVVPLVEAELNRRFPGRELQQAQTPEGLREAYAAVRAAWQETLDTAPREHWDTQVGGEWSLVEILRHLVLATDCWLRGAIQGVEQPFHELGLLFDGGEESGVDVSVFRTDTPSHDEVLAVRAERQQLVAAFLDTVTEEQLAESRTDPWGSDWSPTVGDCVRVILDEEWAHLRYARRDLATLAEPM